MLVLDAINEAEEVDSFALQLESLVDLAAFAPIRVIMTCRSEYWKFFEKTLKTQQYTSVLDGVLSKFSEQEYETAIPIYLRHYRLRVRIEASAWESLRRPLLLRFFCEAYGAPSS